MLPLNDDILAEKCKLGSVDINHSPTQLKLALIQPTQLNQYIIIKHFDVTQPTHIMATRSQTGSLPKPRVFSTHLTILMEPNMWQKH